MSKLLNTGYFIAIYLRQCSLQFHIKKLFCNSTDSKSDIKCHEETINFLYFIAATYLSTLQNQNKLLLYCPDLSRHIGVRWVQAVVPQRAQ